MTRYGKGGTKLNLWIKKTSKAKLKKLAEKEKVSMSVKVESLVDSVK